MLVEIPISEILIIVGILTVLDNVITQVLKNVLYNKVYGNVIALVVGLILAIVGGLAYCAWKSVAIHWYFIPALIVLGFLVSYSAMFGFQALKDTIDWNKKQEKKE